MKLKRAVLGAVLGRRLPILEGELEVKGIDRPVLIRRDQFSVPYIKADSEKDAFFALGFCQGQDRSFQVERLTRTTRGTLSEIFGSPTLSIDRLMARVGLFRLAAQQLELLDEESQALLHAFAAGLNAGINNGCRLPAPEFRLLGIHPAVVEAADSLAILNFVAFVLSPWAYKINRLMVLRAEGPENLAALDGAYPEWLSPAYPVGEPAGPSADKLPADIQYTAGVMGLGHAGGSNCWAINSLHAATGRPILACDPHLSPTIPPHWYLAYLETPAYLLRGAALAGTPFFSIGHNRKAAWGVTGGSADNIDLFLEDLDSNQIQVREKDGYQPLVIKDHSILVKGQEPFQDRILTTPRGPIISDVLEVEDLTFSIQAAWMEPKPISGLFKVYQVHNFQEFRQGWFKWYQAAMNMTYADQDGNIGWQLIGDFPNRKRTATIPLPGWDPRFAWGKKRIPFETMPYGENPPAGLIATANTKPIPGDTPYLGYDFADGYRLARIIEVLNERGNWDLGGMAALQVDTMSLPWREIRETVLGIPIDHEQLRTAVTLLAVWDGRVSADSPAATLYEYFLAEMIRELAASRANRARAWVLGKSVHPIFFASLGKRQVSHLSRILRGRLDVFNEPLDDVIKAALTRALQKVEGDFGKDPDQWAWGVVRPLTLEHPFGKQPVVGNLFQRGSISWGGDSQTVSQAQRSLSEPTQNPTGIANLRLAVEVGNWSNNYYVLAGGQSGNPFSPHYDDQLSLWQQGKGVRLAWGEAEIEEAAISKLVLNPRFIIED